MGAIITDTLKRQMLQNLYDEISTLDSHSYYVGIGRHLQWDSSDTIPALTGAPKEELTARLNLQSIKPVTDVSWVVPRYNWTSGTTYQSYDDNVKGATGNGYYVLTDLNEVYICIQQGKSATGVAAVSTVKPSFTTAGVDKIRAFKTADGYVWKFLYALSATISSKFLTANYLPIPAQTTDSAGAYTDFPFQQQQAQVQTAAAASNPGQVLGVVVTNEGAGYSGDPVVTIVGDGINAGATAFEDGGQVKKVELNTSVDSAIAMGHNYNVASVQFSGGGSPSVNATARIVMSPKGGLGADPKEDLKASSIMINSKPAGVENVPGLVTIASPSGNTFFTGQDFRQVMLLRNPLDSSGDSAATGTGIPGKVARFLRVTDAADLSSGFVPDAIFTGVTSTAKGSIVTTEGDRLWFTQDETVTGFKQFSTGENLTVSGGTATIMNPNTYQTTDNAVSGEMNLHTGDVLYIDNRAAIERSSIQTEDIKIILQL